MFRKAEYLEALEAAILIKHKCKPTHRETVFIREETEEKETVWEGYVDVFDLAGHKEAKKCYAWQHTDGKGGLKIFAVLESQFIDSAKRAVQAALFMDAQPPLSQHSKDWELFKQQLEEFKKALRGTEAKIEGSEASTPPLRGIREKNRPRPGPEG
jgi:hypothetical protein